MWFPASLITHHLPIHSILPCHESAIDQFSTECGGIGVVPLDDLVDFSLWVAGIRVETTGEPSEDDHSLLGVYRDCLERFSIKEVPQDRAFPFGCSRIIRWRRRWFFREEPLAALTQRLDIEFKFAVPCATDNRDVGQDSNVSSERRFFHPEIRCEINPTRGTEREPPHDPEPILIGESREETSQLDCRFITHALIPTSSAYFCILLTTTRKEVRPDGQAYSRQAHNA